ncbi:aminotransferase class I/II-fold pyridoxal phosphate-dependent enzyme [Candidatus Saccharibacteria bacterium]|nr:aminotransferase class I/II-fold pyridoxal phosphate-dependent enzyme [Candidatus Saccharibacteria bacterium]
MVKNKKIYLASPQMLGREREYVKEAFDSNWVAPLGPFVDKLEEDFEKYMPVKNAVALSAGTAALHLAIKLAGVKPGDKVFCSSLTFSASANPIVYEGGVPVFIDSEPTTYNMSSVALEKAFEKYPLPKAVIIVSLYGMPADFDKLLPICEKHGVTVIEDAAESLGATYKGKHVGTFGKYNIISFNGNKIITTSGGGMLLTEDTKAAERALKWATQSREPARHYQHEEIGYNYRMSNVCAAIGCGQFENLDDKVRMKREIFERYVDGFRDIDEIEMITEPEGMESTHWLSIMKISEFSKVRPLDIMTTLEAENIESRPIWKPMHLQPVFAECEFFAHDDKRPVSEELFENGVCLPSDTNMTVEDQERVIEIIKGLFK